MLLSGEGNSSEAEKTCSPVGGLMGTCYGSSHVVTPAAVTDVVGMGTNASEWFSEGLYIYKNNPWRVF